MRVFIGYDSREDIAFRVLCHSIWARASGPVSITPLVLSQLPTDRRGSTDFTFTRFLVPWLCEYEGFALFLDCDFLCLTDITLLEKYQGPQVSVCKVDYHPRNETKFLGEKQSDYPMKCWSSLMLFNNDLCRHLTPDYVNRANGLNLHQFTWAEEIGAIPVEWNHIPGSGGEPLMIHYTEGGPWFPEYRNTEFADAWLDERDDLIVCLSS